MRPAGTGVDLDSGTITVTQQVVGANHLLYVGPPKTRAGERTIALDAATVTVMREHRRRQRLLHSAPISCGLAFCWPDGRRLSPDWLTHRFHDLVAASGLPLVRLHDYSGGRY